MKTSTITCFAFGAACLLTASAVFAAAPPPVSDISMARPQGTAREVAKDTPRKPPSHSIGTFRVENQNLGTLKGPEMREMRASGMGRLKGGDRQVDKNTPRGAPTATAEQVH